MDTSTRTVATSLAVLTAVIFVVHTFTLLHATAPSSTKQPRKPKRKKGSDQLKAYVPGLVNSGNTCFLNSTLQDAQELFQILSSQLSEERDKVDYPTTSSLLDRATIQSMAAGEPQHPRSRRQSVSSTMLGSCMSSSWHITSSTASLLAGSTSTATLNPSHSINGALSVPNSPDSHIGPAMTASFILDQTEQAKYQRAKSPFMGLLASRVSCVDCGYTAAIRHSTFDNLSLTVPMRYSCTIEECLDDFVHLDTIHDFNCRKCTVLNALKEVDQIIDNTQRRLVAMDSLSNGSALVDDNEKPAFSPAQSTSTTTKEEEKTLPTPAQRRGSGGAKLDESRIRAKLEQALQWRSKIQECLQHNIEMDLAPIELTPVRSTRTTKHSMIAKPPQALCLHLNRSTITPMGVVAKNPCRVQFKRILDFTPFTTSGHLTTEPTRSMSQRTKRPSATTAAPSLNSLRGDTHPILVTGLSSTPTQPKASSPWSSTTTTSKSNNNNNSNSNKEDRVRYRLEAVLMHLGSHNSGHFVTFRRVPEGRVLHEHRRQRVEEQKEEEKEETKGEEKGEGACITPSTGVVPAPPEEAPSQSVADGGGQLQGSVLGKQGNGGGGGREQLQIRQVGFVGDDGDDNDDDDDDEKHLKERWWRISDEHVHLETWANVRNAEAYMLFYEKLTD
ncbi:hypothetical protein DFQ26_006216 [Actinomortierella ambigua]|nr:hypothetical protein DFQ26_006216 [Actinomortierella ambigua]